MISHHHKCVFVHIPKCGGTSVEHVFVQSLGMELSAGAPLLLRRSVKGEIAPPQLEHLIAADYVRHQYISQELYDAYSTFALVREPYARTASLYRFMRLDLLMPYAEYIERYLPRAALEPAHPMHWFLRPQTDFLLGSGGMIVDRIVRLEKIGELVPLLAGLGIEISEVPRVNALITDPVTSWIRAVRRYGARPSSFGRQEVEWTAALRHRVADVYASDFELLGYPTEVG